MKDIHWSPDGRFIAGQLVIDACDDPCSRVVVVSADGHPLDKRSRPTFGGELAWGPDMDADGRRPTRLPVHVPGWTIVTADWRG